MKALGMISSLCFVILCCTLFLSACKVATTSKNPREEQLPVVSAQPFSENDTDEEDTEEEEALYEGEDIRQLRQALSSTIQKIDRGLEQLKIEGLNVSSAKKTEIDLQIRELKSLRLRVENQLEKLEKMTVDDWYTQRRDFAEFRVIVDQELQYLEPD